MNPDSVATHSGSSSFHFSFRIEHWIRNEMPIRNHVQTWIEISLLNETRNEIDVHYGRNKGCL